MRCDLRVTVEARASVGIEIGLQSRVALYYGDREVELLLKNRERRLAFHAVSELEELKAESRVIYEREVPPVILARPSKPLEQRRTQIYCGGVSDCLPIMTEWKER